MSLSAVDRAGGGGNASPRGRTAREGETRQPTGPARSAARRGLILASASPQRRAILEQLGVAFSVREPQVEELTEGDPADMVVENARRKVRAVSAERVLAADTAVVLDGRALGKPADEDEAHGFLQALSGRDHEVLSGFAYHEGDRDITGLGRARVRFRTLTPEDVDRYVANGEWRGRAGGYAIQRRGAALVEEIEGDYWAVVGLPVAEIARRAPALLGLGRAGRPRA